MIDIEWDSRHRHRRKPPSRMHAVWNQFRGRIMGNERLIRKGEKESRRVVAYKQALQNARARQTANRKATDRRHRANHKVSFAGIHLPFFNKRHYKTRYYNDGTVELHERGHPYLHYHHRTKHPDYGVRYRLFGFLTGDKTMRDRGKSMHDIAHRERVMARRRRRRELRAFGHAMQTKHRV